MFLSIFLKSSFLQVVYKNLFLKRPIMMFFLNNSVGICLLTDMAKFGALLPSKPHDHDPVRPKALLWQAYTEKVYQEKNT